jgi:uncharacterized protein (TIGR02594 family)
VTVSDHIVAAQLALSQAQYELDQEHHAPWYNTALGEVGVAELPGEKHSERVLEYLATCHRKRGGNLGTWAAGRDETAWCSAFVNWCLQRAGVKGTRHAAARSYTAWGRETIPRKGAIVVLKRDGGGHVGFLDRREGDQLYIIGGNQTNRVSVAAYPDSRLLDYRWPTGVR